MGDQESAIVHHEVNRGNRQQNARHAANDERDHEAYRVQHRRPEHDPATKHREKPIEDFDAGRHRDDHRQDPEERVDVGAGSHREEVVQPNHER